MKPTAGSAEVGIIADFGYIHKEPTFQRRRFLFNFPVDFVYNMGCY